MKLFVRLQKRSVEHGNGLLLPCILAATRTAISADLSFVGPGFHKGGGHVEERDSDIVLR